MAEQFSQHPGHGNARETAQGHELNNPAQPAMGTNPGALSQPVQNPLRAKAPRPLKPATPGGY